MILLYMYVYLQYIRSILRVFCCILGCTTGVYVLTTLECILDSILYMNNLLRISLMNNNQNDCKFAKKAQDALIQYKGRKKE